MRQKKDFAILKIFPRLSLAEPIILDLIQF